MRRRLGAVPVCRSRRPLGWPAPTPSRSDWAQPWGATAWRSSACTARSGGARQRLGCARGTGGGPRTTGPRCSHAPAGAHARRPGWGRSTGAVARPLATATSVSRTAGATHALPAAPMQPASSAQAWRGGAARGSPSAPSVAGAYGRAHGRGRGAPSGSAAWAGPGGPRQRLGAARPLAKRAQARCARHSGPNASDHGHHGGPGQTLRARPPRGGLWRCPPLWPPRWVPRCTSSGRQSAVRPARRSVAPALCARACSHGSPAALPSTGTP